MSHKDDRKNGRSWNVTEGTGYKRNVRKRKVLVFSVNS